MVHTGSPAGPAGPASAPGAMFGDSAGINEDNGNSVEVWGEHYYDTRTWDQVTPRYLAP
jgi:hypothetical protein